MPALAGFAMWSWSTTAILLGGFTEANPVWNWMPFPWFLAAPALLVASVAAFLWRWSGVDEDGIARWFSGAVSAIWATVLVHDVLVVLG